MAPTRDRSTMWVGDAVLRRSPGLVGDGLGGCRRHRRCLLRAGGRTFCERGWTDGRSAFDLERDGRGGELDDGQPRKLQFISFGSSPRRSAEAQAEARVKKQRLVPFRGCTRSLICVFPGGYPSASRPPEDGGDGRGCDPCLTHSPSNRFTCLILSQNRFKESTLKPYGDGWTARTRGSRWPRQG